MKKNNITFYCDLFDKSTINLTPVIQYSTLSGEHSIYIGWLFSWFGITF